MTLATERLLFSSRGETEEEWGLGVGLCGWGGGSLVGAACSETLTAPTERCPDENGGFRKGSE